MLKVTQAAAPRFAPSHVGEVDAPLVRARVKDPRQPLVDLLREKVLAGDPEFLKYGAVSRTSAINFSERPADSGFFDFLVAVEDDPHEPDSVFTRLRWGGKFVYASRSAKKVTELPSWFAKRGFEVILPPTRLRRGVRLLGLDVRVPLLSRKLHYFVARKVNLIPPREISERFTYHVRLTHDDRPPHRWGASPLVAPAANGNGEATGHYLVCKEVPSVERVTARLRHKFPDAPEGLIEKRARKFTEKVFPLFLTREAAMLKILERDLPRQYLDRVPRVLELEQDARGYVHRMWMNWLRAAPPNGRPLTQLDFARQAADLLRVVHDEVGIIHLDLRLDNMVITDRGVGFVDFGSAVRVGENIQGNPLLNTIFDELMRTSQIQRMLERTISSGAVTSPVLSSAYGKVDKGVDLFYLAVCINHPLSNPDFRGLVQCDPKSPESAGLEMITQNVLKPRDPSNPPVKSARDLLRSLEGLAFELRGRGLRR
jgi:hypothetical protein